MQELSSEISPENPNSYPSSYGMAVCSIDRNKEITLGLFIAESETYTVTITAPSKHLTSKCIWSFALAPKQRAQQESNGEEG